MQCPGKSYTRAKLTSDRLPRNTCTHARLARADQPWRFASRPPAPLPVRAGHRSTVRSVDPPKTKQRAGRYYNTSVVFQCMPVSSVVVSTHQDRQPPPQGRETGLGELLIDVLLRHETFTGHFDSKCSFPPCLSLPPFIVPLKSSISDRVDSSTSDPASTITGR